MSIDIHSLLRPISDEAPCGEDLSFAPEIDQLQEMLREDDPTLDQGAWVHALKQADWPGAVALSSKLLAQRSKDLRVSAWLTLALARTEGFAGMAQGLQVIEGLCAKYWNGIHPLPEDGDQEARIGNLSWLLKQVQTLAGTLPLLKDDALQFGAAEIDYALQRPDALNDEGKPVLEVVQKLQATTAESWLRESLQGVEASLEQLQALEQRLNDLLADDAPGFAQARAALEKARDMAQRHAVSRGLRTQASSTSTSTAPATHDQPAVDASTSLGNASGTWLPEPRLVAPQTRAQALEQLRIVAAFFRRTEPHSPVAYLADKAAKWGEMPLHEWLRLVVKDTNALDQIEELLDTTPAAKPEDNH